MLELPWYEIYILPRKTTLESKAREFQHKLLNRTVYFRFSRAAMFGVQKSSENSLLGICFYYYAKLERHFAVALYTNMARLIT